ncbi:MAG: hypothetical protein PWP65_561 [Clostridia bacterium]|nr:hypothetical protein [Clostridia bacterium]
MNCQEARQLITRFVDEELNAPQEQGLYVHLSGCPYCRHEVFLARETNKLLALACTHVEPPAELLGRVMQAVGAPSKNFAPPRLGRRFWQKWQRSRKNFSAIVAAGFLFLAASLGLALNGYDPVRALMGRVEAFDRDNQVALRNGAEAESGLQSSLVINVKSGGEKSSNKSTTEDRRGATKPGSLTKKPESLVFENVPSKKDNPGFSSDRSYQDIGAGQEHMGSPTPQEQPPQADRQLVPLEVDRGVYAVLLVLDDKEIPSHLAWSPDGKEIWYLVHGSGGQEGFSIPVGGGDKTPLSRTQLAVLQGVDVQTFSGKPSIDVPKEAEAVAWSEQGRVAYLLGDQVFTAAPGGGKVAVLSGVKSSKVSLAWSPDSDLLAVNAGPPPAGEEGREGLWIVGPGGENLRRLSKTGGGSDLLWAPDKQKIAFSDASGTYYVAFLGQDTRSGRVVRITSVGGYGSREGLAWSPDGQSLALVWGEKANERGLWLVKFESTAY